MDSSRHPESASLASARDAGLSLLGRLRRWLVVATFALIGILAGLVAQAKPGKSSASVGGAAGGSGSGRRASGGAAGAGTPTPSAAPAPAPSISPPAQPPLSAPPTPAPAPPVVSGGS
jgi:hypothetical protein